MESRNNQLELFSQTRDLGDAKARKAGSPFLAYIWNYEKTILIIIGLVTISIISFSLGVEKGKKLSLAKFNSHLDIALTAPASIPKVTEKAEEKVPGYTIQLASYKTKTHAQKETELLKKRGLSPLVLSKGNYAVLCVGNFSNKQTAQSLLSELRKRYKDCYVRRL